MEGSLSTVSLCYIVQTRCLNPCSNGRLSERDGVGPWNRSENSLNPCSNGRLSETFGKGKTARQYGLNPCSNGRLSEFSNESVSREETSV